MTRTVSAPPIMGGIKRKQWMKKRSSGAPTLRKAIKDAVEKMAEKKAVIASGTNVPITTASSSVPFGLELAPQISQGTSQNQRVGNEVKVVKATIRGHLAILPFNATTNAAGPPVLVKMWCACMSMARCNMYVRYMCGRDHAPSRKRQVAETREPETPQMPDPAPGPHRDPTLPRKPWKSFNVNRDGHPRVCMCIAPVNPRSKVSFTPRRSSS